MMSENDKDYDNPIFKDIYVALAAADLNCKDDSILHWLNENGFANLTCCPICHIDDFTHVGSGCELAHKATVLASAQIPVIKLLEKGRV